MGVWFHLKVSSFLVWYLLKYTVNVYCWFLFPSHNTKGSNWHGNLTLLGGLCTHWHCSLLWSLAELTSGWKLDVTCFTHCACMRHQTLIFMLSRSLPKTYPKAASITFKVDPQVLVMVSKRCRWQSNPWSDWPQDSHRSLMREWVMVTWSLTAFMMFLLIFCLQFWNDSEIKSAHKPA